MNTDQGSESDVEDSIDLFQEPEGFYQPDKPATFTEYRSKGGLQFKLRLVGHSPLWGHLLWNAGQVVSQYLEERAKELVIGKNVLELGAGAGLPSLVCAVLGASQVVVTDYPDADLVSNLRYNVTHCAALELRDNIAVEGYIWGNSTAIIKAHLSADNDKFDLLILADILFNHSEHEKLVATMRDTLKQTKAAKALVFFTPYRPWLFQKDLHFFELAKKAGFNVDKVLEHTMDAVMFDNDPGDELLRRTVFGYEVTWRLS